MTIATSPSPVQLRHGRTMLQLHCRKRADGPNLLLLHELFANAHAWDEEVLSWDGSVWALDFSGHGGSGWREGGVYFPETLAADADAALGELGEAFVAGAGVGAYAALLLAGGRPDHVPAALLLPGEGLAGHGPEPDHEPNLDGFAQLSSAHRSSTEPGSAAHDPRVLLAGADARPADYARTFAERARRVVLVEDGTARPPWWEGLRDLASVSVCNADIPGALRTLANP